jgi:hypothetical protein
MRVIWLLPLLAGCAGAAGQPRIPAAEWPACFALQLGEWSPASPTILAVAHAPPPIIRLDTLRAAGAVDSTGRTLSPGIAKLAGRHGSPYWVWMGQDSLRLQWSSGYEGLFVDLALQADSVAGIARTWTDYGAKAQAPVTGRRVACPRASRPEGERFMRAV